MTIIEYHQYLSALEDKVPGHALLPTLQKGYNALNGHYILTLLPLLDQNDDTEDEDLELLSKPDDTEDETTKNLRIRLRTLFGERVKESNRFHDCRTKNERAAVSEAIEVIQRNIELTMRNLRHYRLNGFLPETKSDYVPKDGAALKDRQSSLRSAISRQRARIKECEALDLSDSATQRRLESLKNKLTELKAQLNEIDAAISNL